MKKKFDYPYVRAFYALVFPYKLAHEVEDAVKRAQHDSAPENATFCGISGAWRTMDHVLSTMTRDWLEAHVSGKNPELPYADYVDCPETDKADKPEKLDKMRRTKAKRKAEAKAKDDSKVDNNTVTFDADIHKLAIQEAQR